MKTNHTILRTFVAVLLLSGAALGAECDPNHGEDPNAIADVTIALTSFDVNEARLEFHYQITNNSESSIWICDGVDMRYLDPPVETYLTNDPNDGNTLHFRRRLGVPSDHWWVALPYGRYTILDANDIYQETITVPIPIPLNEVFFYEDVPQGEVCVANMIVEIGYLTDLPEATIRVFGMPRPSQISDIDEVRTLHLPYVRPGWQLWEGEQALEIIVKGVQLHVGAHFIYGGGSAEILY